MSYLLERGNITVWFHRPLQRLVQRGEVVAVHEQFHAVRNGRFILNVDIEGGIGDVPVPHDATIWAPDAPVITNLQDDLGHGPQGNPRRWSFRRFG
ncbi:hypothetical protein [Agromyces larvae]|uniref:Uncharacterized protein n=1 Tax=Agromyces larvae TaxID=2929802 RepID=A0ABY4BW62_9MICO|nr:hypothetical protein [Agromyces larvae]UOE43425.1 hypothetical protein MTO99_14725 [Agromyces larvae]